MVNTSNLRTKMVVVGWLLLMAVGIAYAVQIQRDDVGGIVAIGRVQTPQETILLYSQITSATADMTVLKFGTGDVDAFGFFVTPREVSFWAANACGVAFSITVEATGVVLHRPGTGDTALAAGVLSLLMGPPNGKLLPSPDHATLIPTGGEPMDLEAGLTFLKTPRELGLTSGDTITFTALFKATTPPTPKPATPTPTKAPTATPTPTPTPTPEPTATPVPAKLVLD